MARAGAPSCTRGERRRRARAGRARRPGRGRRLAHPGRRRRSRSRRRRPTRRSSAWPRSSARVEQERAGTRRSPGYSSSASTWKPGAYERRHDPAEPPAGPRRSSRSASAAARRRSARPGGRRRRGARRAACSASRDPRGPASRSSTGRGRLPASRRGRTSAPQLARAAPRLGLDPEDLRPLLARGVERAPTGSTAVTTAPCSASSAVASPVPHCRWSTRFFVRSPSVALTIGGSPGRASRRARCSASNARRLSSVGSIRRGARSRRRRRASGRRSSPRPASRGRDGGGDVLGLDEPAGGRPLDRARASPPCSGSARARRCRRPRPRRRSRGSRGASSTPR